MKISYFIFSLMLVVLLPGCSFFKSAYSPMIIAHRGASGYATENTLAAVQKAIDLKVDAIEVDVWRTIDDSLVVFHDKHTKRLGGDSLVVPKSTYAQLRALTLPGYQKMPTVREVLELLPNNMKIFLELKNCWEAGKAGDNFPELAQMLEETGTTKQAVIISFNMEKLKDARRYLHDAPLYWLSYQKEPAHDIINRALEAKIDGININFGMINDELVNLARQNNLQVFVWTINKTELVEDMVKRYKVDGITTDFPIEIVKTIKELK